MTFIWSLKLVFPKQSPAIIPCLDYAGSFHLLLCFQRAFRTTKQTAPPLTSLSRDPSPHFLWQPRAPGNFPHLISTLSPYSLQPYHRWFPKYFPQRAHSSLCSEPLRKGTSLTTISKIAPFWSHLFLSMPACIFLQGTWLYSACVSIFLFFAFFFWLATIDFQIARTWSLWFTAVSPVPRWVLGFSRSEQIFVE